ncbi:MAG: RNA polymerase sigma-70 factor [Chitinophagaceae bacterium]|jgi:RNA polymerase sigma-70 factor (ECF subfamily)|nr:RNA polymerase sigma-70 factor [Chitinophagaceae bacterium]
MYVHAKYENALENLHKKFFSKLIVYALSILHRQEIAEEIVSDVFVSIWLKKEELLLKDNLQAYLFKAVHHKCIDYLRSLKTIKKQKTVALYSLLEEDILAEPNFIVEEIFSKNLEQTLQQAIEKLPPKRKEVFLLSRRENLSYQQIANKLSLSVNSVKTQISRSVDFLRNEVKKITVLLFL